METEDIFDRNKIKILSYDKYRMLHRYNFVDMQNGEFLYLDTYTDKVQNFSHRFPTLNDYSDYLILVY
ncbi:Unknown (Maco134) [Spodoptera exigua multiple nucleopolyhedrovirus]|nr:Unknown (Maco134) [Spodoptera exigua multiple nucleopolyhedrovirus]